MEAKKELACRNKPGSNLGFRKTAAPATISPIAGVQETKGVSRDSDPSIVDNPTGPITRGQKKKDPNFRLVTTGRKKKTHEIFNPLPGCSLVTEIAARNDCHYASAGGY